jgi:hypothetical protein
MTKTTHASIIALLLCSSFSIYGSAATKFSDNLNDGSASTTHNQTNVGQHNQSTLIAEQHNNQAQNIMTKQQLVDFISNATLMQYTTEELPSIFANIADTQWPNFIKMCSKLSLINQFSVTAIVVIAHKVPAEQWPNLINIYDRLAPCVYFDAPHTNSYLIDTIAQTEHTKWNNLVDIFYTVKDSIDLFDRTNALKLLAIIPAENYSIIRKYYSLIQPMPGSKDPMRYNNTGTHSSLILELIDTTVLTILQKVPQLPDFLRTIKDIKHYIGGNSSVKQTIIDLSSIPSEHWENFFNACNLIVQTNTNLGYYDRSHIISLVSKIKPSFLPEFIEFVRYSPGFFEKVNYSDFSNSMKNATTVELFKTALDALRNKYLPDGTSF